MSNGGLKPSPLEGIRHTEDGKGADELMPPIRDVSAD